MPQITILHNPRCSKSRQTLQLLQDNGHQPDVIEYLKEPLDKSQLETLLQQLGMSSARELMRTKEAEYKEMGLNAADISEQQLLDAMVTCPKLMERPVVIANDKAAIGRPPEQVLDIL